MIKGLPKATLTMFVVLAALALCATSASARPHGITITCGKKPCAPKHHHHYHGCQRHSSNGSRGKCKRRHHPIGTNPKREPESESSICKVVTGSDGHVFTEGNGCKPQFVPVLPGPESVELCPLSNTGHCGPPCCCTHCTEMPPTEEQFEVKGLEVYQLVHKELPAVPASIWASVEVTYPYMDSVTTVFYAEYGSFSGVYGGIVKPSILTPGRYSEYVPPCPEKASPDGYDTAWVVVYDHTTEKFVESEHVRFNIAEPENVRIANPAG